MTERIGVDFGTANTVVARWPDGAPQGESIPLEGIDLVRPAGEGVTQRVVPSLVAYDHSDDRRRWIGAQVAEAPDLRARPGITVFEATKATVTGRIADIPRSVGERRIRGSEAATRFLGDVLALAVLSVDADDLEVVVTAPVESFDTYRDWLVREVAAGLGPVRLRVVDEATAAAVGYGARMSPGDVFCVVDFGAGTLDVSVVRLQEPDVGGAGGVRPVAKVGLELGGNHIDAHLADHVARVAGIPRGDAVAYNRIFRSLLVSAEEAKVALTTVDRATVTGTDPVTGRRYGAEVSRTDLDRLLKEHDVLGRVARAVQTCLERAAARGHPSDRIVAAFLVGGSCLLPAVQDELRVRFGPERVRLDRPLEAVAAGAAGVAGGRELHDHIQHDYAIRHVDEGTGAFAFAPLVEAGTGYPTEEPVRTLTIKAVHDGQRELGLAVYELSHVTATDRGAEVEIVFDRDGGARTVPVTPQQQQERTMVWLNEEHLTFLEARDPPARAGADRFRLEFHVDGQKRLTVSAFDLERRVWVLDHQPVVRLA